MSEGGNAPYQEKKKRKSPWSIKGKEKKRTGPRRRETVGVLREKRREKKGYVTEKKTQSSSRGLLHNRQTWTSKIPSKKGRGKEGICSRKGKNGCGKRGRSTCHMLEPFKATCERGEGGEKWGTPRGKKERPGTFLPDRENQAYI